MARELTPKQFKRAIWIREFVNANIEELIGQLSPERLRLALDAIGAIARGNDADLAVIKKAVEQTVQQALADFGGELDVPPSTGGPEWRIGT